MGIEDYRSLLLDTSRRRSILIDKTGNFTLAAISPSATHALEIVADPAFLGADTDCKQFEAITPRIPVPLPVNVASPMIDPTRWNEFSAIETHAAYKSESAPSGAWAGTIEEKLRWKMLGKVIDYDNRLKITFGISATGDGASVDFELDKSFSGGLNFEKGFFRIEKTSVSGLTNLISHKALSYAAPDAWCRLSVPALHRILLVWLTAVTAEYALKMVASVGAPLDDSAVEVALGQLQGARNLFDITISSPLQ